MSRAFKGIWIPAELWLNKELTTNEKLFLVEIDSLDNEKGCYASNAHFSEFFGVNKTRCSQIINSLKNKGYVRVQINKKNNQVESRVIRINRYKFNGLEEYPPLENDKRCLENDKGVFRKCEDPPLENCKGSNTSINNTFNNSKRNIKEKETAESICEEFAKDNIDLLEALQGFIEMRKGQKTNLTPRALKLNLNKLKELSQAPEEQIKIINTSVMNGWKSFYLTNETKPKQTKSSQQEYFDKVDMWAKEIEEEQKNGPSGLHEYY